MPIKYCSICGERIDTTECGIHYMRIIESIDSDEKGHKTTSTYICGLCSFEINKIINPIKL